MAGGVNAFKNDEYQPRCPSRVKYWEISRNEDVPGRINGSKSGKTLGMKMNRGISALKDDISTILSKLRQARENSRNED